MSTSILFEVVVVLVLVFLNGLLSMAEIAVVSSRKARLQERADAGDDGARAALELARAPNPFLSTVQVGITLIGILAGAYGGAQIAEKLAEPLRRNVWLEPWADGISFGLVVTVITLLSLILGELVPKRLGLHRPETIAAFVARPMQKLSRLVGPAVTLLAWATGGVLKLLRVREDGEAPVTEEEIKVLVEQGTRAGVFDETERSMVTGVFRLADLAVGEIMTRRPQLVCLRVSDLPEENVKKILGTPHAYFPVFEGDVDNVLGVVSVRDLWLQGAAHPGEPPDLKAALVVPLFVPESLPALELLERFRSARSRVALVVDEFGGLSGLVRLTDVLEAVVGGLPSAGEAHAPSAVRREDGSWLMDGLMPVHELKERLDIDRLPREDSAAFETLAGFVVSQLGRVPATADKFSWNGFTFEVVDMDGKRVDQVLVTPPKEPEGAAGE